MKTKVEIEKGLKAKKVILGNAIEESMERGKAFEEVRKRIEGEIKELQKEVCFEDTLAGKVMVFVEEVEEKIKVLVRDLEQNTGVELDVFVKFKNLRSKLPYLQTHRNESYQISDIKVKWE